MGVSLDLWVTTKTRSYLSESRLVADAILRLPGHYEILAQMRGPDWDEAEQRLFPEQVPVHFEQISMAGSSLKGKDDYGSRLTFLEVGEFSKIEVKEDTDVRIKAGLVYLAALPKEVIVFLNWT